MDPDETVYAWFMPSMTQATPVPSATAFLWSSDSLDVSSLRSLSSAAPASRGSTSSPFLQASSTSACAGKLASCPRLRPSPLSFLSASLQPRRTSHQPSRTLHTSSVLGRSSGVHAVEAPSPVVQARRRGCRLWLQPLMLVLMLSRR